MRRVIRSHLDIPADADDHCRLVLQLANRCAGMFSGAGLHVSFHMRCGDLVAIPDLMRRGVLLAAIEIREVLASSADGRKALRDLGFEPLLEDIEGE